MYILILTKGQGVIMTKLPSMIIQKNHEETVLILLHITMDSQMYQHSKLTLWIYRIKMLNSLMTRLHGNSDGLLLSFVKRVQFLMYESSAHVHPRRLLIPSLCQKDSLTMILQSQLEISNGTSLIKTLIISWSWHPYACAAQPVTVWWTDLTLQSCTGSAMCLLQ